MSRLSACSFLFSLLLLLPLSTVAQGPADRVSLSGTVYSEHSNRPVEHANVKLCDGGNNMLQQTITTDSGEFYFHDLARGDYILVVDAMGYEVNISHLELSFGSDRGQPIYLKPTPKVADSAPASSVSAHEMAMPKAAQDLMASGKKKLYVDKNVEGGLADFQQAVSIAPAYYEAQYQIGMAYLALSKPQDAENSFQKSIEISGDKFGDADVRVGSLMLDRGNYTEAEKKIRRGIELNSNLWLGHYELGRALLTQNRIQAAQDSAERARLLAPGVPVVYRLLANIHLQQKNYSALVQDIDAYLKLDPDSPAAARAKQLRDDVQQKIGPEHMIPASAKP